MRAISSSYRPSRHYAGLQLMASRFLHAAHVLRHEAGASQHGCATPRHPRAGPRRYPMPQRSEAHREGVTRLLAEGDRLNLKIVIADGGSTDRTLEIARRLS